MCHKFKAKLRVIVINMTNLIACITLLLAAAAVNPTNGVKCFDCVGYVGDDGYFQWSNDSRSWVLQTELYTEADVRRGHYYNDFLQTGDNSCEEWELLRDSKEGRERFSIDCVHGCLQLHSTKDVQLYDQKLLYFKKGCWNKDRGMGEIGKCHVGRLEEWRRNFTKNTQIVAMYCPCDGDFCNNAITQPGYPSSAPSSLAATSPLPMSLGVFMLRRQVFGSCTESSIVFLVLALVYCMMIQSICQNILLAATAAVAALVVYCYCSSNSNVKRRVYF